MGFGKKKRKSGPTYRNYGTLRDPDTITNLPYTGKAKIVIDLYKNLYRKTGTTTDNTSQ